MIFFDLTWTHILAPRGPYLEFIKQNFNFQSLRKKEAILLTSMWLKDQLTIVKTFKIVTFCYFWTKMSKNFVLFSFKYGVSSYFNHQFPLRYFYNHSALYPAIFGGVPVFRQAKRSEKLLCNWGVWEVVGCCKPSPVGPRGKPMENFGYFVF